MKKLLFVFLACGVAAITLSSCTKSAWELSYSRESYVEVDGLKWATKNVGATEDNPYGNLYNFYQALEACPDGWRLPTGDELEQLSRFHSEITNYGGMNGMWFSGATPYKEGVDAVFLPMAGRFDNWNGMKDLGSCGYYLSSTADYNGYTYLCFFIGGVSMCVGYNADVACSVRCLKN